MEAFMTRGTGSRMWVTQDSRFTVTVGASLALLWLAASFALSPAAAAAAAPGREGTSTDVRDRTVVTTEERSDVDASAYLGEDNYSSGYGHPLRRRAPSEYRRQSQFAFLNVGGGVFDPSHQPGDGFFGVISAGTEAGQALDLGVQMSWYHRGSHGERVASSYVDPAGNNINTTIETQSVDTDLVPLMGIVRVKFPVTPQFQPYVGGGVGYEWLLVEGVDNQGISFSNNYGGFGAQAIAGVNLSASPSTALYAEAVYNFTTVDASFYSPFYGVVVHESLDFDGIALHGGLKFRF
jgi:opacity protein-like surface antigen